MEIAPTIWPMLHAVRPQFIIPEPRTHPFSPDLKGKFDQVKKQCSPHDRPVYVHMTSVIVSGPLFGVRAPFLNVFCRTLRRPRPSLHTSGTRSCGTRSPASDSCSHLIRHNLNLFLHVSVTPRNNTARTRCQSHPCLRHTTSAFSSVFASQRFVISCHSHPRLSLSLL